MTTIATSSLRQSWAAVTAHGGDIVAQWFYAHLFVHHPEARELFAVSMTAQRDRLVTALGRVVSHADQLDDLRPYLEDLGRNHRRFGAIADHYPAVGASLLATLRNFTGDQWNDGLEAEWAAAYSQVAAVMTEAAAEAAKTTPPHWDAQVADVERRTFDIAVLRIHTAQPVPYVAGQSLPIEATARRPRVWRPYTPANPPGDTEIELHVRLVAGGPVSTALVRETAVGDAIRIGSPQGRLTLAEGFGRPLLLVAGGTGLAPMKALVRQLATRRQPRRTHLYVGARTVRELYDADVLSQLDSTYDWLTVTTVVSDDSTWRGPHGVVGEIALAAHDGTDHDVYICGSPAMVTGTLELAAHHGIPTEHIRYDAVTS